MISKKSVITALLLILSTGTAYADMRDVVYDAASGTIVRSSSGACVRTQWSNCCDLCATEVSTPRPIPRSTIQALSREERTVYFGFNQASLSPEMKERLDTLATKLKSDRSVQGARIVGYADRIGSPGYNERLSQKRAEQARRYLESKGIINARVAETRWVGASEPVTECSANLKRPQLIDCLQKDRRVEVEIDYYPEQENTSW